MKKKPLPPTYFTICLLLSIGLHFLLPIIQLIHVPYRYIGVLFIAVGGWLHIWAHNLFKKRKTTVKPFQESSALIIEGPFRFSRNPMYLGIASILLGAAILCGSLTAFIPLVAYFIAMTVLFIPHEEKAMEETFGEEYLHYKRRTRRWL